MPRRFGRPGLMGTMARTAVIAGTATAVSGGMQRRAAQRSAVAQDAENQQQQATVDQAGTPADDPIAKIKELGELKSQGLLTDEEFTAAKAKILGT